MARLLVVEDEPVMAEALAIGLRRQGHVVDLAADGWEALTKTRHVPYALVVLDRDLPVLDGDEVCRRLNDRGHPARIIMVTAAREVGERVAGLRMGADDYLTKPFSFDELSARIEALLRRPEARQESIARIGDLEIDRVRHVVRRRGEHVELTTKEFRVLEVFVESPGAVFSAEELLDRVWDENADPFTNAVRITMVGLRRKLGEPAMISTLRGRGYRLDDPCRGPV